MSGPRKSIAFFKVGSNSHKNPAIAAFLAARFAEYDLRVIDAVDDIVRRKPNVWMSGLMEVCHTYAAVIVRSRRNPMDFICRSRAAQAAISGWARKHLDPTRTAFVFQNQSLFCSRSNGIPFFLYTDHTYRANRRYPDQRESLPVPAWWPDVEGRFYVGANGLFTTSQFARQSLIEDYGVAPAIVECVYSGANVRGEPRQPILARPFPPRVLFVGIDWVRKGGPDLLEAFRLVRDAVPEAELWIVGCSPRDLPPGAKAFGYQPPAKLSEFYREASIFCLPTHRESAGIAFTEAALHGLPSVACDVGGVSDRVVEGRTGHLVPAGDPITLAARLKQMLLDLEYTRTLGLNAWDHASGTFTWEAVGAKIERTIRGALQFTSGDFEENL